MLVILLFRFEILRALSLDERDEDAGPADVDVVELLGGSDRAERRALARTFVDFSKDSAIREATRSEAFSCDSEPARFHFRADEFRAIDPPRGADAPESTSRIDSSSSSKTITL